MSNAFRLTGLSLCLLAIVGCSAHSKAPLVTGGDTGAAGAAASAAGHAPIDSDKVLDVYNWADFMDPSVISAFEQEYGIKVNHDVYDSNEQLETKLLVGHSDYDLVVPGGAFFERQIQAGVYQKLDKAQLPNLKNVDPEAVRGLAVYDPGNQYGVNYMWLSTSGIGLRRVGARCPGRRARHSAVPAWQESQQ